MYYKSILTNWFCIEISRNEWDIGFWGLFWLLQKMAAKFGFWEIGERVFLEDPKKYTFGKSIFKTFYKNRKSEILPPFLSTWHSWIDSDMNVFVSVDGGPNNFFTLGPSVLAPKINLTTVLFVIEYIIVCCRSSLKMFYKIIFLRKYMRILLLLSDIPRIYLRNSLLIYTFLFVLLIITV